MRQAEPCMVHVINYVRARGRAFFSERSERRLWRVGDHAQETWLGRAEHSARCPVRVGVRSLIACMRVRFVRHSAGTDQPCSISSNVGSEAEARASFSQCVSAS
jgi:hypothetical protein